MSRLAVVFILLVLMGSSLRALAATDACPRGDDPAVGPLAGGVGLARFSAGVGLADFGAVPETCGATDAALRMRTALLVASTMPDYYGNVIGTATLRGRYQLRERSTVSLAADVFTYRYVNTSGLVSQGPSIGPATAGFHQLVAAGADAAASLYARVLLPLDSLRESGILTGLELGGSVRLNGAHWAIDGGLSLAAPLEVVGGQAHGSLEPGALAEAWLRLRPWAALGAGASVRVEAAPKFELVTTVPRVAARFAVRRRFWVAALAEFPVTGGDRTDLIGGLYAGFIPD